jgi:hypothetical protein
LRQAQLAPAGERLAYREEDHEEHKEEPK